jgi:hypothetical protein
VIKKAKPQSVEKLKRMWKRHPLMPPGKYRVRVVGNSRSGTDWFTRVLNAAGLDVGHEYLRKDGTVSCYFFIDTHRYPLSPTTSPPGRIAHVGERYSDYKFDMTLHIVRDPLKCIGSIWSTMQTEHQKWLEEFKVIPTGLKPKLLKSMHTWYEVNRRCERIAEYRFNLEHAKQAWPDIRDSLDIAHEMPMPQIPVSNRSRGIFLAKKLTWRMMVDMDKELATKIAKMASYYGYRVPKGLI